MKNLTIIMIFGSLIMALTVTSCKKKKKEDNPAPTPTGIFEIHLHTNIDSTEVEDYNTIYTAEHGRKVSFSIAQLYISDIQLVYTDGSTYDFADKKILKVLEQEAYIVGNAPVGNYKSVRFKVGLSSATNLLSPTTPSDSAILNKSEMWFSSSAQPDGYVFLNLQGKIDTTTNANGTIGQMQPFEYKIGTNANYKQVVMPDQTFSIMENQASFAHIVIDYYKLFDGIQLNQPSNLSVMTVANNGTNPAQIIANNIANMFIYE